MGHPADLVALIVVAAAAAGVAARLGLSSPLMLTGVGLVLSFIPGTPSFPIEPEVVLFGFLPPLLYATALRTPWVDLRTNRGAIGVLSVGLVIATSFAVAGVLTLVLPGIPFGAALALGAVVAPPDAVAATAVARRVGMPRRVVTLLEGESLLNDATALVLLRTALAAVGGTVTVWGAVGDFVLAAAGGAAIGWALAQAIALVRRWVEDPILDTTISLIVPFAGFLLAEEIHASGVIAVVVAGLISGARSTAVQSAVSRVTERTIWRIVQFALESVVFLVIGLQLRDLLARAMESQTDNGRIAVACVAVLITVIAVRFLWVFPGAFLPHLIPAVRKAETRPPVSNVALLSWAGMRGVVTLAAAFTIPEDTAYRDTLLLAAFTVVAGTLMLQGPTLPMLMRWLRAESPDPAQDALQRAQVQLRAAKAGLHQLAELKTDDDSPDVIESLHSWGKRVSNAAWERLGAEGRETPSATFYRLRVAMLEAERQVAVDVRNAGTVPHDIVDEVVERIDQEEAMLSAFSAGPVGRRSDAVAPAHAEPCDHMRDTPEVVTPQSEPDACPDCLAEGHHSWVHLRMCLECGHIGCCDSSPGRHATAHFHGTRHPVIRSIELDESWRWCYVDTVLG